MSSDFKDQDVSQSNDEILSNYNSIEQFTKDGYKVLMEAIRYSNSLPSGSSWNFYNTHESFAKIVASEGNKILGNIKAILCSYNMKGSVSNISLDEKTELMVEANDTILERVADNIDEMNGIKKTINQPVLIQMVSAQLPINGSWNRINNATFSTSSSLELQPEDKSDLNTVRLLTAKNIVRPQKLFKDKINNSSKYPWEPRIKEKPNSLKPLAIFLEETENGEEYSHPYEFELDRFNPEDEQLAKEIPVVPLPIEKTPLIEITTNEEVDKLVENLRQYKEFSVDLEHHSYRSFMGITCLLQISTKDADYIIDTLALRDKLYVLNEVFTKSSITKIFHGAEMDIQWLQRDLSLYVINMFDTYQAAKVLEYSGRSLAYLMKRFCNVIPNKQFQLADWRIRPLPNELKKYAREDTHYLIYIYHMMKNELLAKANGQYNILKAVFNSSTEICKKRYFRPVLREDSYMDFYRKCKRLFDNRQLYALKELYNWRDEIAREEDESLGYVLPNHMLLQISEMLPREIQGILACCNPIPPLVRANLLELHKIILKAREQPLEKPILQEDTRGRGTTKKVSKINVDSPLHCPHDLTKQNEFQDDLPTLLGNNDLCLRHLIHAEFKGERNVGIYSVFNNVKEESDLTEKKVHNLTFLGPYERYKLVKSFIQSEEERVVAEKAQQQEEALSKSKEEPALNEEPSDKERIEIIRQHFLALSKLPNTTEQEGAVEDQTLMQMGGSRKRKRVETPLNEADLLLEHLLPPLPSYFYPQNNQKKKTKLNRKREQWNTPGENKPIKKNLNKKFRKPQSNADGNCTSYDYSSVNFDQFQGGAKEVNRARPMKSKFKNRVKKKKNMGNNNNNKSGTFENSRRGNRRGR